MIHRFWLKELGIAGDYVLQAVEPERVAAFLADFADTGYVGGNVTVPHKEAAFAAVAAAGEAARAIGAVNTIWLEDGRLVGDNTDSYGFLANLDQNASRLGSSARPAIVLGAGGAARAVVFSLLERGFGPVHVVNRTASRAAALADRFGEKVRPGGWEDIARTRQRVDSGQHDDARHDGQPAASAGSILPATDDLIVTDLVYVPLETPAPRGGTRTRPSHGRRTGHAPAPGRARLRTLVRQAAHGDAGAARGGACDRSGAD